MSAWPRLLAATVLLAAGAHRAAAQDPHAQAEKYNDEGKAFLIAKPMQPADAAERFQKAIDLVPEGRYYANLCLALYHEGKLGEALTACRGVSTHGGDERAVNQANNLMEKAIKPKMREAGIDPDAPATPPPPDGDGHGNDGNDGNGTSGNDGNGTSGNDGNGTSGDGAQNAGNFTVAPPPSLLDQKVTPKHQYTWTLGVQLFGASVKYGFDTAYENSAGGIRATGDYLIMPKRQVGLMGFVSLTQVGKGVESEDLTVADLGVGIYKDFCSGHLCIKPLVGVGIALFQTQLMSDSNSDSLVGLAGRGEVSAGYAFGPRYEHLITATLGAAGYTKPVGDYENDPADYGFTEPGRSVYFGVGYTHRFNTPFGKSPFFVLQ